MAAAQAGLRDKLHACANKLPSSCPTSAQGSSFSGQNPYVSYVIDFSGFFKDKFVRATRPAIDCDITDLSPNYKVQVIKPSQSIHCVLFLSVCRPKHQETFVFLSPGNNNNSLFNINNVYDYVAHNLAVQELLTRRY